MSIVKIQTILDAHGVPNFIAADRIHTGAYRASCDFEAQDWR